MKVVVRVLLVAAIILLGYLSWESIQGMERFNREVEKRDNAVIQRLVDIRTTQVAYRSQTGTYTPNFDELANFIKTGKVASVARSGDLTEAQLEAGMTEERAMTIIRGGNESAIRDAGLWDDTKNAPQLVRDSIFAPASEVLFPDRRVNPDSLAFVPFGQGTRFEMAVDSLVTGSGYPIQVFEAKTPYTTYLSDLDRKLVGQKIQEVLDRPGNRYPGMMVGSLEVANNNAGNWE
ncbi:MAG: hypothetical protein Q4G48_07185 [Bacteroidia bacterium]|nr:hypothetical protein [Bacteroidia bacterium]